MNTLNLIYARAFNGVIGRNGRLPWYIPEDLNRFRALTRNQAVLMGRKTWDSLPPAFKPLPDRINIVLTSQADWEAPGALRVSCLAQAFDLCEGRQLWVIGGAQLYQHALPYAQRIEATEIDQSFEGDTYAPELGPEWRIAAIAPGPMTPHGLTYRFVTYLRVPDKLNALRV